MEHKQSNSSISSKEDMQQVPETPTTEAFSKPHCRLPLKKEEDVMDELEGFLDITDHGGEKLGRLNWDFMDWDGLPITEEEDADGVRQNLQNYACRLSQIDYNSSSTHLANIKQEEYYSFPEDDEKKLSLNLSLNYQEVLEAWSDRTPWADESSFLSADDTYSGEVPVMEEERRRREASVIRYREKRQSRLFSKKIRYQVRKLNADKRPRLKGRFVKRIPAEKIHK